MAAASNEAFVQHATLAQLEQVEKAIDRATEEITWCVELEFADMGLCVFTQKSPF